jgi:hypothetical protein
VANEVIRLNTGASAQAARFWIATRSIRAAGFGRFLDGNQGAREALIP